MTHSISHNSAHYWQLFPATSDPCLSLFPFWARSSGTSPPGPSSSGLAPALWVETLTCFLKLWLSMGPKKCNLSAVPGSPHPVCLSETTVSLHWLSTHLALCLGNTLQKQSCSWKEKANKSWENPTTRLKLKMNLLPRLLVYFHQIEATCFQILPLHKY